MGPNLSLVQYHRVLETFAFRMNFTHALQKFVLKGSDYNTKETNKISKKPPKLT